MKRFKVSKDRKSSVWTYYDCNGAKFIEDSRGHYIKVSSYIHFLRILVNSRNVGFAIEIL